MEKRGKRIQLNLELTQQSTDILSRNMIFSFETRVSFAQFLITSVVYFA